MKKRLLRTIALGLSVMLTVSEPAFIAYAANDEIVADELIIEEPVIDMPAKDGTLPESEEIIDNPDAPIEELIEDGTVSDESEIMDEDLDNSDEDLLGASEDESEISGEDLVDEDEEVITGSYTDEEAGIYKFPASYQSGLYEIWKAHPNWKFERQNVKLDWDTVVANEMLDGRSLIEGTADKQYVGEKYPKYSGWYYATKAGVEHYLDPRNALDESHIFMFEALKYNSEYQSEKNVKTMVTAKSESFMRGALPDDSSKTYSNVIYTKGKENDTNPLYLVARIFQEQGYKGTDLTNGKKKVEGKVVYNFFNIKGAYPSEADYAYQAKWFNSYKALSDGIKYIATGYINVGQDTLYLQKWDMIGPSYYTHQYMQNIRAPFNESVKLYNSYKSVGALNNNFVFKIPVYENMPSAPDTKKSDEIIYGELKGIAFEEAEISLKNGEVRKLVVDTTPKNVTPEPLVLYSSSNSSVASVDGDGNVTANGVGTAKITATVKMADKADFTAQCSVKVSAVKINYMNLSGKCVKTVNSAMVGSSIKDYPYSDDSVFLPVDVKDGYALSGYYTEPDRKGVRVSDDTVILGDMNIYPYLIEIDKGFEVKPVGDYYYTGAAIRPAVEVYNKDILLTQGKDYTLTYKYNKAANASYDGETSDKNGINVPTIIVTGKGNYSGSETLNFNIRKANIKDTDIADVLLAYKKSTKPQYGKPAVFLGSRKLVLNQDYVLEYPMKEGNNVFGSTNYGAYIAPGSYPILIKGINSLAGEKIIYQTITRKTSVGKVDVNKKAFTYIKLPKENINAKYLVDNGYLNVTYKSTKLRLLDTEATSESETDWDYRLELPDDMITPGTKVIKLIGNKKSNSEFGGFYGTKRISFSVKGNVYLSKESGYDGSIVVTDETDKESVKLFSANEENLPVYAYKLGGVKPDVVVRLSNGGVLKKGTDYTVSYKNCSSVRDISGKYGTIIIKGKGFYRGSAEYYYEIVQQDIKDLTLMIKDPVFSEKPGKALALINIFDTTKKILKAGKDYDRTIAYSNAETGEVITKTDILPAGTRVCVSVNGIKNYKGCAIGEYTVKMQTISKAVVAAKPQQFTGRAITITKADLDVYVDGEKLDDDNYEIMSATYSNNINKGTASVYIRGNGNNYGGVKKVSFKISALPIVWYYNK